ncbi:MAG TPA: O-antigen ligase family protein [Candidatus Microsaccharimonas sp.]|nr:O-antigen ligase family protein [Candidatus Microsaccharimonas sp.]
MGSLARVGGAFHQPDLLAIWLVCGWIIGFGLWPQAKKQRWGMAATQTLLLVVIVLSQSRMALLLLIVISLVIAVRQLRGRLRTMAVLLTIGVTGLVGSSAYLIAPHNRVIDSGYSTQSIQYRLTLQSYGVHAVSYQPIVGYGPANIQTGISCLIIHDPALIRTCQQGYYFESSHNIFLDRFIGLGLLGGSAYIIAVGGLLYIGKRQIGIARYVWYAALAICVYYLTNITSVSIELLLWVLLCRFGGSYEDNEA